MAELDASLNELRVALVGKQLMMAKVLERDAQLKEQLLGVRAAGNDKSALLNSRREELKARSYGTDPGDHRSPGLRT